MTTSPTPPPDTPPPETDAPTDADKLTLVRAQCAAWDAAAVVNGAHGNAAQVRGACADTILVIIDVS